MTVISNLRYEDEKSVPTKRDFSSFFVEMTQNNKFIIENLFQGQLCENNILKPRLNDKAGQEVQNDVLN